MGSFLPTTTDFFCTAVSADLNEHQYGTAVHHTNWFLLEYRSVWQPKAPAEHDLPPEIMSRLDETLGEVNGRLQFIRQPHRITPELSFFIVIAREQSPVVYQFSLESYEALLDLNIEAVLAEDAAYAEYLHSEPLLLVCTHGRRDRCCAKFGLPVYVTLANEFGDAVWQTTHTGGHRFAPTLLTFPDGVSYGRLTLDTLDSFITDQKQGQITLDLLRGRTCYPPVVQIADYHLRRATGITTLEAYVFHNIVQTCENEWVVSFFEEDGTVAHQVIIEAAEPLQLYASSGSFKLKSVLQYVIKQHIVQQGPLD
jgi:hypothetical protein